MTKSIKNSIPVQPLHGTAKKVKKSATTYFSSTADVCTDELDVNLPYASIVGFAWGIPDAQSCRWLCGHNHPEATHFTWLDYRTNHQIANSLEHKCNCKKDVSTKKDEVGAVSGVMHCDIKGKWKQRLRLLKILTIIKRDVRAGYFRNLSDQNHSNRIGTITENFMQPQR